MNETQESFIIVVLESDGVVFVTNRSSKRKNEREREIGAAVVQHCQEDFSTVCPECMHALLLIVLRS